ncbi:hypothetical protein Misp03_36920 [Microbispora sp. NBRC 16548]|nr:hypothetical protein Misp03_36920 [Microbispora sp. NBRC 16548]
MADPLALGAFVRQRHSQTVAERTELAMSVGREMAYDAGDELA